eukprot:TRINITY_DN2655_c0_g1_i4.p1 TRINITY_DN2655_c0_g1~~TRINITY_DN2655_c0_g1_i4.p1  ORF type:complete len:100 (+),score=23.55 TRINITY_DN2655_c0_g1_i4:64-363(+)
MSTAVGRFDRFFNRQTRASSESSATASSGHSPARMSINAVEAHPGDSAVAASVLLEPERCNLAARRWRAPWVLLLLVLLLVVLLSPPELALLLPCRERH